MEKKWIVKERISPSQVEDFSYQLKIQPIIAELLLQRKITSYQEAKHFFRPNLEDLHDPFLMKNMTEAVSILQIAIEKNDKILLFGDYDVDGTTSVSLLYLFLKEYHPHLAYYIPDRYKEGYGLSKQGIDFAHQNGFSLLILLDCGTKSVELVDYGRSLGLDFIICDHHQAGTQLPNAYLLNPKQNDCPYPYKELCGCGVGFKLLQGLCIKNKWALDKLYSLLDFVAVAIGADIVPVTGENRILAHHGMRLLNELTRLPFKRMATLAQRSFPLTLTDVVFTLAPRINSAGRIHSGSIAVELMTSEDTQHIEELALNIEDYNKKRKELDHNTTQQALKLIDADPWYAAAKSTVIFDKNWHKGVVGIVASRLIEKHFKPTIVLTENEGKLTGSARTINHFDLYEAIQKCEHLLEQFGGHTFAAGLTLKKENLEPFKVQFDQVVRNTIQQADQIPNEIIDIELQFNDIYEARENRGLIPKLKRILKQMEPHGPHNMKPIFYSKNVYTTHLRILKEHHLRIEITQPNTDIVLTGIGFFLANKQNEVSPGVPFEMIYTLESNIWNQKESLQLNIKDVRSMV